MTSVVLLRDKSGPGSWLRESLQGLAVYRLLDAHNGDWPAGIPRDASALAAWFAHLAASGFGVIWLASSPDADGAGYGGFIRKAADLHNPASPTFSLTSTPSQPLHSLAAQALASGLALMVDLPSQNAVDGEKHAMEPPLGAKFANYRWSESTPSWVSHECRAAAAHSFLAHFYRASRVWPLWMVPPGWLPSTLPGTLHTNTPMPGNRPQALQPLQPLLMALSLSLQGSSIWNHRLDSKLIGIPDAITHFLRWKKTVPALLYGKMRLLGVHDHLLVFMRQTEAQRVLCVFNLSDRYVRQALPVHSAGYCLIAGSGLDGGRIVNGHIDCDPWG
ncbi:MAG: hypothetical protein ORN29_09135, partial [Rhodoferax sp.]|nr:hypothetical protein [Rhodoferax sp.]